MMTSLVTFALVAGLLTITPGLDTLLVLRASAAGGRAAGMAAAAGIALGVLVWATASAVGVTALLAASRLGFDILRIAGAVYLCWLGARALWLARRRPAPADNGEADSGPPSSEANSGRTMRPLRAFRTGLTTNLLNPKV